MKKVLFTLVALATLASADQTVQLKIKGMMCPACVANVKRALGDVEGVKESTVYLKTGRAEVTIKEGTSVESMCAAVKNAGYGCTKQ